MCTFQEKIGGTVIIIRYLEEIKVHNFQKDSRKLYPRRTRTSLSRHQISHGLLSPFVYLFIDVFFLFFLENEKVDSRQVQEEGEYFELYLFGIFPSLTRRDRRLFKQSGGRSDMMYI